MELSWYTWDDDTHWRVVFLPTPAGFNMFDPPENMQKSLEKMQSRDIWEAHQKNGWVLPIKLE